MLEKIDKKFAEICAVGLTLTILAITASVWYTYISFKGVFNPLYAIAIWLNKDYENKWPIPKNVTEFQAVWEKANQGSDYFSFEPYSTALMLLVIGAITFYLCILTSMEIIPFLMRQYIKIRFGTAYYSVYMSKQNKHVIKINRAKAMHYLKNETDQEIQLESLRKAEREHYEQWKKYNKSELSLNEWKSRVLVDKENH